MVKNDPHFRLRIPADLKARVEESAKRNNRSVNAEILQALKVTYPPEPSVEELLDTVHVILGMAQKPGSMPYREALIDALERLQRRVASGLEFDQFRPRTPLGGEGGDFRKSIMLHERWKRALANGVDQRDLERELADGLFDQVGRVRIKAAIDLLRDGRLERAMMSLGMGWVKFAEPDAAREAIQKHLRAFYAENWGDPDERYEPWEEDD